MGQNRWEHKVNKDWWDVGHTLNVEPDFVARLDKGWEKKKRDQDASEVLDFGNLKNRIPFN